MSSICSNCDFVEACMKCIDCNNESDITNSIFCNDCSDLHKQIKIYKGHKLVKYSIAEERNRIIICQNCDQQPAKFLCMKCQEKSNYFCGGCSIMHTKVKAFRDHITLPLGTRPPISAISNVGKPTIRRPPMSDMPTLSTLSDSNNIVTIIYEHLITFLNRMFSSLDIPIDFESYRHNNVKDTGYGIVIALIIYTCSKLLFGKYGTGISIIGTVMVWRLFVKYEKGKVENVTNKFNETIDLDNNNNESSKCSNKPLDEEFWHDKPSKPSSFKPRGRSFNKSYKKNTNE